MTRDSPAASAGVGEAAAERLLASAFSPKETGFGTGFALALPIIYGVCGFIFTAIGCAIYNFVAGLVGGIEVELDGVRAME
jgi:hypothetical protein